MSRLTDRVLASKESSGLPSGLEPEAIHDHDDAPLPLNSSALFDDVDDDDGEKKRPAAAVEGVTRMSGLEEIHNDAPLPFNSALFEEEEEEEGGKRTAASMNVEVEEETNQPCLLEELDDDAPPPLPLPFNSAHLEDDEIKMRAAASVTSHSEVRHPVEISSLPKPTLTGAVDDGGAGEHDNTASFTLTNQLRYGEEALRVAALNINNTSSTGGTELVDNNVDGIVDSTVQVIPHAYLVDEVYDYDDNIVVARYAEPLLPWWKQRRTRGMFALIVLVLLTAAIVIGILVSRGGNADTVGATIFLTLTSAPSQSNSPSLSLTPSGAPSVSVAPSSVPTKECLLCKDVFGRQFETQSTSTSGVDYLYQIKVCNKGDTSTICGVYQTRIATGRRYYLGSFAKFVNETDTSVTAIFQDGESCGSFGNRFATVTFIGSCSQDCGGYEITTTEPVPCEYEFTATLTSTPSETPTISVAPSVVPTNSLEPTKSQLPSPRPSLSLLPTETGSQTPSGAPTISLVPTKECLLCKVVFGRQFETESGSYLYHGQNCTYLYQIKVCNKGDTSSNCGVYQTRSADGWGTYLGSFAEFVNETDTSVTAIFQDGNSCGSSGNRFATVIFNMNDCKDCVLYAITASEPVRCEYEFTVTLTDA